MKTNSHNELLYQYLTLKGRGGLEGLRSVASRVPDPGEPRGPAARG